MARTITADELVEEWKRKQKGSSKTQKSVETPKISNADELVAYWKEQKQAQNQQFAVRARAARADKYENLVNSMRPEERVNLFTSNAGEYSEARENLKNTLSPERYSALEDRARNTYIPAQFWQKFADNERNQQYAQRYQNTYVPASLAQDAIHRSGTGNDFNAYSDAALRGEYLNKVDTGALQAELDALNAELSENKRYYDGAKRSLDSIARVKGKDDPTVQSYQKTVADYEEKQARAAQLQRDIHDSDAVKKYNAYESLRANADFAERSQAAGSKRVQFNVLDPSTWGVGDDKYDFVNDIDGYRNTVKFISETQGAPTSYGLYSALSHITDDEKAMYNYLYATKGKEAAEEYLNYIEEGLNYRQGKAEADIVGDNLLKAAGYGIRTGAERFGTGIAGMFNDEAKAPAASEYGAQFVRENLADTGFKLPEWMGGASVGQTVFDLSNTAGNMAPSILLSVLTAGAGAPTAVASGVASASMGLSAGGSAKAQALRDGYTPEQATRYGVLIGASEGALQYLLGGIGKLGGKLTGGVAQKAIQNIDDSLLRIAATGAIKMAGEGTEEYLQEILDPIYRNLLFNENNQIDLTDPEAVYSFLLGALTAAVMDGSEIVKDGKARPSSLPNVNGALVAADAAQNIQSEQTTAQTAGQETEQYVYTDETTGIPMVGTRRSIASEVTPEVIARNKKEVAQMAPVAAMDGTEFPKGSTGIFDQVAEFFQTMGNKVTNAILGNVTIDRRGIKDSVGHGLGRNKAIAFKAVPQVIQDGKIIDYQKNWKGRGYDTVVLAAPVTIKGEPYYEGVILIRPQDGQRFYLHEVLAANEKDMPTPFKTGTTRGGTSGGAGMPSLISLLDEIRKVNAPENNIDLVPSGNTHTGTTPVGSIPIGQGLFINSIPQTAGKINTAGGINDMSGVAPGMAQIPEAAQNTILQPEGHSDTISLEEEGAIRSYKSGMASYAINEKLYSDVELDEADKSLVKNLDAALEKLPDYEGTTYRVLCFDRQGKDAYDAFIARHVPNTLILYGSYTSASKTPDAFDIDGTLKVRIEIEGKTGKDVSEGFGLEAEQEVLYGRNIYYTTKAVETAQDGTHIIKIKEVNLNDEGVFPGREKSVDSANQGNNPPMREMQEVEGLGRAGSAGVRSLSEWDTQSVDSGKSGPLQGKLSGRQRDSRGAEGTERSADSAARRQAGNLAVTSAELPPEYGYDTMHDPHMLPMVGTRPVLRMNTAAEEVATTLDGATKYGYSVQEGANGGADLRARGKTIHLDAMEATAIAEAYAGGMDALEYAMAFHTVYEQAKQGKELGFVKKAQLPRDFAKPDISEAYSAGRLANQRAEALDPNSKFKSGVTVLPDIELSKEQETQLGVLDVLCRKYGVTAIADTALYLSGTDIPRSDVNAAYNGSTNRIHINLNAIGDAYLAVGVHELTHYVRANNAAGYSTLEGFVLDVLRDGGEDVDALIRYQMEQFGYSEELAREEVIANTIPAILNDEAYVKKLVETDRTLAERIRDFLHEFIDTIKETLRTLEGEASWKQMQSVRQDAETLSAIADMFDVALEGTQNAQVETSERGERFSIKYDVNNRPFVEVDEDILAGVPRKEWVNAVKENLRAKFPNGVAVGGNEININQTSRREMTFSKYMQWALKNDRAVYADKLRATNNADEIIRASRDYVNEALLHPRKDSIREFARGEVLLRVGNNDYAASVIVGTYESGHMLLYDVISLKPTSITERQNKKNTATKQRKGEVSRSAVFIDNIPQSDTTVKNSIRGGGTENSSEKINLSAQDTEAAPESNINAETPRPEELTGKRKAYKRRHERAFIENVAKALGIPGTAKGELRKMISELGDRVIAMGQLSEADKKAMFEKCYEAAREQDNSMVEQYSDLKNYLRSKPILSTNLTSEQRTQARGKLRVNGNGSPIGNVYDDLLAEFPGVFDDSITSPEDQFAAILSMYDSIQPREYTLDEFYGESAAAVKMEARANFEEELFQLRRKLNLAERAETVAHIRQQERLRTAAEAENIQVVDRALSEIKEKQKELERVTKNMVLTEGDRSIMDAVFNGGIQLEELKSRSNFYELKRYYEARAEVESRKRVIDQYNKKRRERLRNDAMNAIENSDRWKDKRIGALYERETQERNIRDITGNNQDAERIIAGYFQPIHDNEAKRTQYINDMNDRMLALKKDEKRKSVGLNKWESKATQLIGERIDYEERLAQLEKRGMGRSAEARMALAGLKLVDEEYSKLMKKHANKIDLKVCEAALPTVREIYDQVFQDMNDALVRNGYPKVEYRENYFPHFIGREYDSAGQKIAKAFGFNLTNMELPTDIVGLTSAFRPGKTWFANALERAGVKTEFDLYGGFDSYIRGATDVIFHTDDIQRLRALDNAIRYKYSDEGRRDRMRELMKNEDLTPDEREAQIHALYTDEKGKSMTTHLSGYVSNLTEYTNLLANKKSFYDRADEKRWGRTIYDVANWYQNRYAGNAIAGNLGVALSNFIPITQATSEVGTITLSQAMRDTAKAFAKDDGFSEQSAFLTNRRGTDRLASDLVANANNKLSIPFEAVDRFASETLVRAKYAQNLKSGMTAEAAMENADAWAAGLMADRSKGALPTIFGNKSPLTKAFTMFQVEVNNQLSYMFKDVPQDMKAKGVAAVAAALFKMFLAAWMYNELDEQITGRRRALDPLHMIAEAVGVDWKTENVIPRITGAKTVEEAPLFSYEPQTWAGAAESIGKNVVDQTPFFGSLLGGDGGRSPAAGATPDLWRIAKTLGNDEADSAYKKSVVWDELKKPLFYIVPPFAGGQVKKAIEGAKTVYEGGSYKKDKDGNDVLRFRTDQTGFDYAQAALFGPWALPEGRENIAKGFPILSAPDTTAYKNAIANGVDGAHFLLLLDEYKNLEPIKDADGNTEKNTNQQFREILFRDSSLTPEQKKMIDRDVIGQEKTADYTSKDRFIISTTPMEFIHLPKDDNAYESFTENVKNGMSEEDAALVEEWRRKLIDIETYTDEDGNEIEASQQKREMLFNDPNLTPEQKEMIDRQVIMGDGKNAKPADYSSSEAMMEASQLKGAHADKVKFFEAAGGTAEKYLSYYNLYSGLEPTKDINGEEIAGSREEALRNEIMNDDDMTPAQKRQLDEALTGGKTRNYISWFAFELTKISKTAYKRGKAYVAAGISEAKAIRIEQWMSGRDYKKEDLRKYLVGLNLPESQIEAVLKARY